MTDTRFASGPAAAYVTDTVLALGPASGIDGLIRLVAGTPDWDLLADAAREAGVTALAMHDGGSWHLGVVGDASIVVRTADGERRFDGGDSWCTDTVEQVHVVTLAADRHVGAVEHDDDAEVDEDVDLPYRTDAGVVPASVVRRRVAAAGTEPSDPFELLFGHTVARSVEGAAVRPRGADRTPQPALGVLLFATGERVVVDRPIVLGRNPTPILDDADPPRLVELARPGVSRRHAAIRVDRWTASIDDLGSVNGTTITLPGRPAVALRPGHPVDLQAGAVVDLGGEVSFVVEEAA